MEIFEIYRAAAKPEIALGQKAYLRHQFEFIGLKTPERRALSRDFLKDKAKEKQIDWVLVDKFWAQPEREFQYLATDYLRQMRKCLSVADLPRIKALIVRKSWWDSVDSLDELVGALLLSAEKAQVAQVVSVWAEDENFWVRRVAIDCQLSLKSQVDSDLLALVIEKNLAGSKFENEFFINKAIGWALRDYSRTNSDWVRDFLVKNKHKMKNLSVREASKYLD